MSQEKSSPVSSPAMERELVLSRILNAPRSLVFKAWTDAKQLAQWWGPTGFTNPVCELDLKINGEIRIDMRAPNGVVYPMSGAYREIVPPERLVFTSAALDATGKPMFENLNTITFEEFEGNKTVVTVKVRVLWETPEAGRHLDGMAQGWTLTIDRLDNFMSTDISGREMRASRFLKAPRSLVYRMWTEPEHVAQWWGPRGFTATIHTMDVRPGGEWKLILHGPDGTDYPNEYLFEETVPPERLVMHHTNWPDHRKYVTFAEREGGTEVFVLMVFESGVVRDEVISRFNAQNGLNENLDRLEDYLSKL
jgi:uncharacterized protein YndB with AHSA1/START domain